MKNIRILVSATWGDYQELLELKGDSQDPSLVFDLGKLEVDGYPEDWGESLRSYLQDVIEEEASLLSAVIIEESGETRPITWDDVRLELNF